ncbi:MULTISPECIES: cupin domain-containing protein [Rhodobacterales]|jgi:quercetin dioxygenase-like cupin family protein|uniref:cupin domain-containing protein n=1 Tax=Rhodobacterales TaxID=204455 RepID=UPI00237FD0FC|nr:cupin domain-containing protein [Phaeobacter gallaeciensis]MDE4096132.1 cupin domain-containing protein [Phaeobacter gallaeciensis]MDE4104943.1 cupin domain-containing protein [Phaeobacter gallaeciensis]MDE4109399.1 cupin domain-containing protein [Phaeobacter gallaeciensis]MDE4113867.1 cupin domain-containing protein [Phaeobacter gallaeciensis]MDE4118334.1 cupin domain-containing protein [Phaeobacter gallaeciensis]
MAETIAEMRLPTQELRDDIPFYTKTLGMKLDMIYPADDPRIGVFSGHGLRLRIERGAPESPGTLRILTEDPEGFAGGARSLTAPNGTKIEIEERHQPIVMPDTVHSFVVRRLKDQAPWIIGRAGMHYRDLVPDRLGGSIIASHIRIPDGGPVPDMVHFHRVGFQLIFCIHGWVDVVYEDQGEKMRLTAGDCFIQPPEIRHRVLEASDNVQVIEIGVPAEHVTEIDHEMTLPTPHYRPDREWQGQRFVYNQAAGADWVPFRLPGFVCRDTTINDNTKGVASVQVVRRAEGAEAGNSPWASHDTDILFTFVMEGSVTLHGEGRDPYELEAGDAFVIPPGMKTRLSDGSADLELLEVSLPGTFNTKLEEA